MDGIERHVSCPYKTEEGSDGRYKPPWALIPRLDGVSRRLEGHLRKYNVGEGFRLPIYTSRLALDRNLILVKAARGEPVQIQCAVCTAEGIRDNR